MKKIQLSIALLLLIGIVSCKKTDNGATTTVSTDQLADLASGSLASTTGLSTNFDDMTVNAESLSSINGPAKTVNTVNTGGNTAIQQCGTTLTDSLVKSGTSNSVTFSYFLKYTHTLNCDANDHPAELDYNLAFHGSYHGPYIAAKDTGTSAFTISGFGTGSTVYTMNGTYSRKGAFTSQVGNKISGTSLVTIVVTNLTVTKSTRKIASGNATITVVITLPKGNTTYTGSLVFNGDDTATFTLSGAVYNINLITGSKARH
jgi:hypothetical protein